MCIPVCASSPSVRLSASSLCPLFNRCGGAPARRLAFPPGQEEADTVHQGPAERTGERVRRKQIHHQGQEEEDLRRDQPVGAADHHLVPEQEGEGEEVRGQSEEQRAVACRLHALRTIKWRSSVYLRVID